MTGSNDSLRFYLKYNFIQLQLCKKISIENEKLVVTKLVTSDKPLHVTVYEI